MNKILTLLVVLGLLCMAASPASAGQSSARMVAMGDAYMGLARGVDAARKNPANLGLIDFRQTTIEIVGAGANISNNSFTLSDYNKYTGAVLTSSDKQYILSRIPMEGLKLTVDAEAAALSASKGQFAFTVTGVGAANVNLSKDIFELVFNGNTFADTVDVSGSYSEAVSYVAAGLSYGRPVYNSGTRQLAVGGTLKYIYGIANEEVVELEGLMATDIVGFYGEGSMIARTATGGNGYALDLGASLKLNDTYTVGLAFKNFLSHVSWSKNAEEHGYVFSFDTTNLDNMEDDHVTSDDYTKAISGYSSSLPAVMTVGAAKRTGWLHWAVDWEQGFRRAAGASTKPRLAAGLEMVKVGTLPVRIGYALGGDRSASFSFGSGFNLAAFYFDWAMVTGSSFSGYSSKGLNLAVSTGLQF